MVLVTSLVALLDDKAEAGSTVENNVEEAQTAQQKQNLKPVSGTRTSSAPEQAADTTSIKPKTTSNGHAASRNTGRNDGDAEENRRLKPRVASGHQRRRRRRTH